MRWGPMIRRWLGSGGSCFYAAFFKCAFGNMIQPGLAAAKRKRHPFCNIRTDCKKCLFSYFDYIWRNVELCYIFVPFESLFADCTQRRGQSNMDYLFAFEFCCLGQKIRLRQSFQHIQQQIVGNYCQFCRVCSDFWVLRVGTKHPCCGCLALRRLQAKLSGMGKYRIGKQEQCLAQYFVKRNF